MTSLRMLPMAIALSAAAASTADARPRPAHAERKHFESNKGFGLGLELGAPTSLNGKYWLGDSTDRALDFGIGYLDYYYDWHGFVAYTDYLFHPVSLASTDSFELPFYVGPGLQYWHWDDYAYFNGPCDPRFPCGGDALGLRVPLGIAFDFNNVPLDIFIQVVPTIDLFFNEPVGYPHGALEFDLGISVGIRYYFT